MPLASLGLRGLRALAGVRRCAPQPSARSPPAWIARHAGMREQLPAAFTSMVKPAPALRTTAEAACIRVGVRAWASAAPSHPAAPPPDEATPEVFASEGNEHEPTCVRATLGPVPGTLAELLSDSLLGLGAQSVVVVEHREEGAPEQEIFADPGGNEAAQLWDACDVVAYFALEHEDVRATLEEAVDVVGLGQQQGDAEGAPAGGSQGQSHGGAPGLAARAVIEPVANAAWVDQIKASYVPLQLSERLHIVPEHCQPTDPAALNVVLQPGVAFGTGEHPTTRMCVLALERLQPQLRGADVMDYGTGSGVLALAALLLGARSAVGTDTDPLAVRSAMRNAELTGVPAGALAAYVCGPQLDDPEPLEQHGHPGPRVFGVVVANILRGPLVELQPRLTGYCRPSGGLLVLSGILAEQVPEIQEAYGADFAGFEVAVEGTWACVTARRR